MNPDLPLAFLDFGDAYEQEPEKAVQALSALLLDRLACAARVEFLLALRRQANAEQSGRVADWPDAFEAAIGLILELGLARSLQGRHLNPGRLDALTKHPDALWRLHQAMVLYPATSEPIPPTPELPMFKKDDLVTHPTFGSGRVRSVDGETTIVRFETVLHECLTKDLQRLTAPDVSLTQGMAAPVLEVIARMQAEAVRSVSESWSVLSRSRIDLLPHQLWVCKKVLERWPARWLVADDVGLGKTIEAGLLLLPLLASGRVKRLLIMCPAGLVDQWQQRLRDLFDIRTHVYSPDSDREGRDYWGPPVLQVVASLQTLRLNSDAEEDAAAPVYRRWARLLAADPWDLVLVDEAHHLNSDEDDTATHGYRLLKKMEEANRIRSMVFFTGTPHRGKDYNFLALLALLRPGVFDPERLMTEQLARLPEAVIRNNKQTVTDLEGKRLFHPPVVKFERYHYSPEETRFYDLLTEFILTGKAYASHLADRERRAVMLVLIALQKLASSSVAAIRSAIRKRLGRIHQQREELDRKKGSDVSLADYAKALSSEDEDTANQLTERIDELAVRLRLMENEETRLADLLTAADAVKRETKIDGILDLIDGPFAGRQVLLFTEYKATQTAVLEALSARHSSGCAAFINGDDALAVWTDGGRRSANSWELPRRVAADRFNAGEVRFLVSTEAGGEGIDLQERCHSLIHVDLPWNPMRLHQRVGRINRYGQTKAVEVYSLRNEDTVEALIWQHLEEKLEQITRALGQVVDDPEDMKQLVVGMASPSLFQTLFSSAPKEKESAKRWFDSQTATLGGQDMIEAVRDLVGHCARFDFGKVSAQVPRIDLPDLEPFLVTMLELNKRRVTRSPEGLTFKTPEKWEDEPGVRASYDRMTFDRRTAGRDAARVLGVGHKVIDLAVNQVREYEGRLGLLPAALLPAAVFVFRLSDRATGTSATVRSSVVAVEDRPDGPKLLLDWELLKLLNGLNISRSTQATAIPGERGAARLASAEGFVRTAMPSLDLPYQVPQAELLGVLWPDNG